MAALWLAALLAAVAVSSLAGAGVAAAGSDSSGSDASGETPVCEGSQPDAYPPGADPEIPPPSESFEQTMRDSGLEHIADYEIRIDIQPDGAAVFTETITYDFGGLPRHGIYRDIITAQRCDSTRDRIYPLTVESVSSETAPDQYVLETWTHGDRIKIGDPDRTITGSHTYEIVYAMDGTLNGFEDHDELYWNVIGDGWTANIFDIAVSVAAPEPVTDVACFAGYVGSVTPCSEARIEGGEARFDQVGLYSSQSLTIVVALPKGAVSGTGPILRERWSFQKAFSLTPATVGSSAALLAAVIGGWGILAFRVGRDLQVSGSHVDVAFAPVGSGGTPIGLFEDQHSPVEFVPPEDIRPGQMGVLIDEVAHPVDVTATIVDLAVRGYLRIEEIPKGRKPDFRIVRLQKDPSGLLHYERLLLDHLVPTAGSSVELSDLKYKFVDEFRQVVDALYDEVAARGWFSRRPDKTRIRWLAVGVVLEVLAVGALVVLAIFTSYALVGVPLVIGSTLFLIGSKWMPRRSAAGTGMLRRVKGFEVFIKDSEAPRARWAEQKNIFSEYLPYAVVLGCADRWARTFEDLGAEAVAASGGWYVGTRPFSAYALGSAMDDFTTSTSSTISTPAPSTSSGSGFSGGFSGGGGGGGGGGSW